MLNLEFKLKQITSTDIKGVAGRTCHSKVSKSLTNKINITVKASFPKQKIS